MKSIVLCERTLVQEKEDFSNLKEGKVNEERNEKTEEKKNFKGVPEGKISESDTDSIKKGGNSYQNGNRTSSASFREEVLENDEEKRQPTLQTGLVADYLTSEADSPGAVVRNSISSDKDETDCSISENLSSDNEVLESLEAENGSESIKDSDSKSNIILSVENFEIGEDTIQIKKTEISVNSPKDTDYGSSQESFNDHATREVELHNKDSKKSSQPVDDIILDMDENKENVKEKTLEEYSENDLNKDSDRCEIQVGEVQTMSGAEKDSMWTENEQDLKEKLQKEVIYECQDISISNDDSINTSGYEKEDENHDLGSDETMVSEAEENVDEGMHIELEESEPGEELKVEENETKSTDLTNFSANRNMIDREEGDEANHMKMESGVCRKRQGSESNNEDPFAKKKKLFEDREETGQSEEENTEDSSLLEYLASPNVTGAPSKGKVPSVEKVLPTKRILSHEKNTKKLRAATENEETDLKKESSAETVLSVLENFRGTLKTLTRSDLEELIVQKLCEVVTERSSVGELRRKAQALEQDQERWKIKAQSLTKQIREMEMVMKKYMTEVQKQIKEGETHVVTPLKVTRSVGLQVSFYSNANKGSKVGGLPPQPSSFSQNINTRNTKVPPPPPPPPPKLPPQFNPTTQTIKNKVAAFQKSSPPLQKLPVKQHRRPIAPKPDYNSASTNRSVGQQSPINNSRVQNQSQIPKSNYKPGVGSSPQQQQSQQPQPHHQQQSQPQPQQQQQQQQNGSKVIDLTEDDDRQTGNVVAKTPGSIRVVNHLTQPPAAQNNRFAYLLPTSSASTGTSGQSRQVLIATPTMPQTNRQIMCSMPPLLFKGGNLVQSGSQSHMLNQSNKVTLPKTLRHPAPLPKRPLNQNTRPSLKLLPPRPALKISKVQTGIVLSWNMALSPEHAPIASYQLYAYQESDSPPATSLWKKVGDVKALPLPMACTLTQFMSGHRYHFAVRAVDLHSRIGPFSFPGAIALV